MMFPDTMSLAEIIGNFRSALVGTLPAVERAGITWREDEGCEEWGNLAQTLYQTLVVEVIRWGLPQPQQAAFHLPAYGALLPNYRDCSVIIQAKPIAHRLVFHSLTSLDAPFDGAKFRTVGANGHPMSDDLHTLKLRGLKFQLYHG